MGYRPVFTKKYTDLRKINGRLSAEMTDMTSKALKIARFLDMSRTYVEIVAKEAGALRKIGRVTLINVKVFEEYLEQCKVM